MRYLANGTRMWTIQNVFKSLDVFKMFQFIINDFAIADSMFSQYYPETCKQHFSFGGDFCSCLRIAQIC